MNSLFLYITSSTFLMPLFFFLAILCVFLPSKSTRVEFAVWFFATFLLSLFFVYPAVDVAASGVNNIVIPLVITASCVMMLVLTFVFFAKKYGKKDRERKNNSVSVCIVMTLYALAFAAFAWWVFGR